MPVRKIVDAWMETPNVRTIRIDYRDDPVRFDAGQFVTVADHFRGLPRPVKRAYSIASSPLQTGFLDLSVKREAPGLMSCRLTDVPVGYELEVGQPNGKFAYKPERDGRKVLLLGAGSGITPLHSIARTMLEGALPDAEVFLFYSVKTPEDVIYRDLWPQLAERYPQFRFFLTVTRADRGTWPGRHGRITDEWVKEHLPDASGFVSYICGPGPFVESMEALCSAVGLPDDKVYTEKW